MAKEKYPVWYIEDESDIERLYNKGLIATRERETLLMELVSGTPFPFLYKGKGDGYVMFLEEEKWYPIKDVLEGTV